VAELMECLLVKPRNVGKKPLSHRLYCHILDNTTCKFIQSTFYQV
jgi:hypothetical protein